jgi:hydrogenase maturation factor
VIRERMIGEDVIGDGASATVCDEHHCITCGDDGDPMTVVRVDLERGLALCADDAGKRHTVETALVEPVTPGDRILVHAGTAIAALTPEEAA